MDIAYPSFEDIIIEDISEYENVIQDFIPQWSTDYQELVIEKQDIIIEQLISNYELGFHSLVLCLTITFLAVIYHTVRQFII